MLGLMCVRAGEFIVTAIRDALKFIQEERTYRLLNVASSLETFFSVRWGEKQTVRFKHDGHRLGSGLFNTR